MPEQSPYAAPVRQTVPLATLHAHARNYKKHNAKQIDRIAKSLATFGQGRSVVVWHDTIIAGHGVVAAARSLGWTHIQVDALDPTMPEAVALAYLVADNELARLADPDQAALAALLQELGDGDAGLLAAMGYDDGELRELLAAIDSVDPLSEAGDADDEGNPPQIEDFPVADLLAPYPYFGGKRAIAGAVWARFGVVENYVEPFFGSGAMLLSCPDPPPVETINDLDGFVANFWRAVAADPAGVARYVDWPVNENDLFARHLWLVAQRGALADLLHTDPTAYDAKIAGWWCWGACNWIGTGWCDGDGPWQVDGDTVSQLPHAGNAGRGVNRQLPHAGDAGRGDPTVDQCAVWSEHLASMMQRLSDRLRRTRVACGDWARVVTSSITDRHGLTAVFLDPPYAEGAMEYAAGGNDDAGLTAAVRAWCIENGDNPLLRIAYCGYDTAPMPGWTALRWSARKGYQNAENAANRHREVIWFSPHCLQPEPAPAHA